MGHPVNIVKSLVHIEGHHIHIAGHLVHIEGHHIHIAGHLVHIEGHHIHIAGHLVHINNNRFYLNMKTIQNLEQLCTMNIRSHHYYNFYKIPKLNSCKYAKYFIKGTVPNLRAIWGPFFFS